MGSVLSRSVANYHKVEIMKRKLLLASAAAFLLGAVPLGSALADTAKWPTKPVRIVVAYPPGGATDTQARLVAKRLTERWGQTVIVDNKPGGNTVIATDTVAKSAPDGNTLLLTAMPFVLNPFIMEKLPYDSNKDLTPVTVLTTIPNILVANPDLGVKNVPELIRKAKASPGSIAFASTGMATSTHLSGELFASMTGTELNHVPYKGSAPAHQDLLGGRIAIMFDNGALQHVKAGKLLPLGVTSAKRLPWLPDVPTIAEQGLRGYETEAWYGVFAPGGTPRDVVERIAADITWAIRSPEAAPALQTMGAHAGGGTPAEFRKYLAAESKRWGKLVKERGIKVD